MLKFSNPGEIDLRLITTMGVNVKENSLSENGPIGYFGTGLKYAIAGILRSGGKIEIHAGAKILKFSSHPEEVRGKEFNFIRMNETPLGFTTELGQNWKPWMWYRELVSNTLDEGGEVWEVNSVGVVVLGETNIYVEGLDEEHTKRGEIFISGEPLASTKEVDIFQGNPAGPNFIYYRNVRAGVTNPQSLFRYNIKCEMTLTEDRTLESSWAAQYWIGYWVCHLVNKEILERFLLAGEDTYEHSLNFDFHNENIVLDATIEHLMQTDLGRLNPTAVARIESKRKSVKPAPAPMSRHEQDMLSEARKFLSQHLSVHIAVPVNITESLGDGVHGVAWGKEILLGRLAFEEGIDHLIIVLLEEWLHAERNLHDYTREIQTWLLNKIVSTARQRGNI